MSTYVSTSRSLTIRDIRTAQELPEDEAERLAAPILDELKALADIGGIDPAGIARRGGYVFDKIVHERWPRAQLAAAYRLLYYRDAQYVLLDSIQTACVID